MKRRRAVCASLLLIGVVALSLTMGGVLIRTRSTVKATAPNLTQYVNPFVGTQPIAQTYTNKTVAGFTFPGADTPFGMAQFSPDTSSSPPGGYSYNDSGITGFSLTHLSGAGCPIYQDIPFTPYVGAVTSSPGTNFSSFASSFSHSSEVAHPGYYSVSLGSPSNVKAELTTTPRTGFGQFTYPASTSSTMLIYSGRSANGNSTASATIDSTHQMVTGSASSGHFCAGIGVYKVYFAAQFDVPFSKVGTWAGSTLNAGSTTSTGNKSGAYVTFNTAANQQVHVRVGISFVSINNAKANLQAESPSSLSFSSIQSAADSSWNQWLNKIAVGGGSTTDTQTFYTALYHALLFPSLFSDTNGQYRGFDNSVYTAASGHAQYANYSGWDIYHGLVPLLAMLAPSQTSDMMQSLVNDYQQSGCLPKWTLANTQTNVEDGDSADPIIAEAYAFGATHFDTGTALQAMIKGATQGCTSGSYIERPALSQYLSQGYIPYGTSGVNGTSSATLEYAADDFAISQFARALNDPNDATTFAKRAENWQNVFNTATGYIEPRNADGTYPSTFSPTSLKGFHDGNAAQYSWMVPYNVGGLFTKMGGNQNVVSRLNNFFKQLNAGPTSAYAYMGNEPNEPSPWEYDFAGQPWQTQNTVRRVITQLYTPTPNGLAGNDDLGEISSWYVWGALGMFPEYPGAGNLVLGSPLFSQITISLDNGHQVQISASGAADNAPYVQSLSANGQASTQLWQPFSTLANGASFQFVLGTTANTSWGTGSGDVPPSY